MTVTRVKCEICPEETFDASDWYLMMRDEQNFAVTTNRRTMRDGFTADICPDCAKAALQQWLTAQQKERVA